MAEPRTTEPWSSLREAFEAGRVTEHRKESVQDRRVEFDDGTFWYPDGRPDLPGSELGAAAVLALTCLFGTASLVLFMDAHPWALPSLVPFSLCIIGLVKVLRRRSRIEQQAEARLERGLFLLDDAMVLRDPPFDERIGRASIEGFVIRRTNRGEEKPRPWVHVVRRGDDLGVPLAVTEVSLPELQRWLARRPAKGSKARR